jgi:hypothetical protein
MGDAALPSKKLRWVLLIILSVNHNEAGARCAIADRALVNVQHALAYEVGCVKLNVQHAIMAHKNSRAIRKFHF